MPNHYVLINRETQAVEADLDFDVGGKKMVEVNENYFLALIHAIHELGCVVMASDGLEVKGDPIENG